jgi:hypothetical protein
MNKFSYLLDNLPELTPEMLNEALTNEYWNTERPFMCISGAYTMRRTKFVEHLENTFGKVTVCFLKTSPYQLYDWHTDPTRSCAINWLVKSNPGAITLHRWNNTGRYYWDIEEVKYQLLKPTLFNVKQDHCVINNFGDERIILSISVMEYPYDEVLTYLKNLDIEKY